MSITIMIIILYIRIDNHARGERMENKMHEESPQMNYHREYNE